MSRVYTREEKERFRQELLRLILAYQQNPRHSPSLTELKRRLRGVQAQTWKVVRKLLHAIPEPVEFQQRYDGAFVIVLSEYRVWEWTDAVVSRIRWDVIDLVRGEYRKDTTWRRKAVSLDVPEEEEGEERSRERLEAQRLLSYQGPDPAGSPWLLIDAAIELGELKPTDRALLRDWANEVPLETIARQRNIKPSAAKLRIWRALESLRELFGGARRRRGVAFELTG
jgi:hypothetical protein